MSSLQVDSISSMGGGHVDGAGLVVQCVYHQWDIVTTNTSDSFIPAQSSKLSFTPKFADSLLVITYDFNLAVEWQSGTLQAGGAAKIYHNGTALQAVPAIFELFSNAVTSNSSVGSALYARQTKINSVFSGSTSARDIELYFASQIATGNMATVNRNQNHSNLLVLEIAQ